jgi:hypothetical protein
MGHYYSVRAVSHDGKINEQNGPNKTMHLLKHDEKSSISVKKNISSFMTKIS